MQHQAPPSQRRHTFGIVVLLALLFAIVLLGGDLSDRYVPGSWEDQALGAGMLMALLGLTGGVGALSAYMTIGLLHRPARTRPRSWWGEQWAAQVQSIRNDDNREMQEILFPH